MMKFLFSFLLSVATLSLSAQQWPFEYWHEGKIVLESGDTLRGQVKYDLRQDIMQFTDTKQTIETFSSRKVLFAEIFDKSDRDYPQYRQFYSLPYSTTAGYRTPVFFELLAEGKLTLLARERLEVQTSSSPYYYGSMYSRTMLVYSYYLLKENGDIVEFSTRKTDVMELMGKYADHVNEYMKDNKLRLDNRYHLSKIIAYYNSFFKTTK